MTQAEREMRHEKVAMARDQKLAERGKMARDQMIAKKKLEAYQQVWMVANKDQQQVLNLGISDNYKKVNRFEMVMSATG